MTSAILPPERIPCVRDAELRIGGPMHFRVLAAAGGATRAATARGQRRSRGVRTALAPAGAGRQSPLSTMSSPLFGEEGEIFSEEEGDMGARFKIRPQFVHRPRPCHPVLSPGTAT